MTYVNVTCPKCKGTGNVGPRLCKTCDGLGNVDVVAFDERQAPHA